MTEQEGFEPQKGNGTQRQTTGVYPVPEPLFQALVSILSQQPWSQVHQVLAAMQTLKPLGK